MNRTELADVISDTTGLPMDKARAALNVALIAIMREVAKGGKVELIGFGSFSSARRDARKSRNPSTGEPIEVPAKTVPVFKAGKDFKETVDGAAKQAVIA